MDVTRIGTPLADAANPPDYAVFGGPVKINPAGDDNPMGPNLIWPGIHANQDVRPVLPGDVSSDGPTQALAEKNHAANVQIQGVTDDQDSSDAHA